MELEQKVRIKEIGVEGEIIGIWYSKFGEIQYNVRYYDTTKRLADTWLTKDELETMDLPVSTNIT